MQKYIFVVGGVISGVGKGVAAAAIGKILQQYGFDVTAIKIDPYLNVDAGTLRPTEHGEVFVTEDGFETDQDIGNYERFLNINLTRENSITSGQIYKTIIEKERRGEFLGKTVQFIPDVIEEIKQRIVNCGKNHEITISEIGGTIGDYENIPFLLAAKRLERDIGKDNVLYILVSYLPVPSNIKEAKTKPTQQSIKALYETGIFPDFILCRAIEPLDEIRKNKIANYVNINKDTIISAPDVEILYEIPLNFEKEGLGKKILEKLKLKPKKRPNWKKWTKLIENIKKAKKEVTIGIVGKYLDIGKYTLEDSYISIKESLISAGAHLKTKVNIKWLDSKEFEKNPKKVSILKNYDGVIIPGGFGASGTNGKILAIKFCRENKIPFLGLCYGLQLAVIEIMRNLGKRRDANTTEICKNTSCPVIDLIREQKRILSKNEYGGTMRLGAYAAKLEPGTIVYELYKKYRKIKEQTKLNEERIGNTPSPYILERHRHRYEVNPAYHKELQKFLVFSGYHITKNNTKLVEFIELPKSKHPFFVATQAHPEFKSRFEDPSPLFLGFIEAVLKNKKKN